MVVNASNAFINPGRRVPLELSLRGAPLVRHPAFTLPARWEIGTVVARSLLDHVHQELLENPENAESAMIQLFSGLYSLRSSSTREAWDQLIEQCVEHPIRDFIHQDPFTARSFNKPRGYAGDAVMIDYIYTGDSSMGGAQTTSPLGELIFRFTTGAPASAGVRTRRDLIASIIDETCTMIEQPQILSVACGHLREATLARSVASHQTGRFVALDQDQLSLDVVRSATADAGIVPVCSSIKSLFRGDLAGERFDLIYSTGLYDYLDERIASKLTARLFTMLSPGGRLLIANFVPEIWCAAYMETFMGWRLIYRTPQEIDALADTIPTEQIGLRRTFMEKNANIVFLDLRRRQEQS